MIPILFAAAALAGVAVFALRHARQRRERDRIAVLLQGQTRILEMIAVGRPLPDVLAALSTLVEQQSPGMLCSVLLLDGDRLRHGGAPSLPPAYRAAIDGTQIGPTVGSCGTAAFTGRPVVVSDIATDPLWDAFRDLALAHELRACWSFPIVATDAGGDGRCLGTFAMYYREPRTPTPSDWHLVEIATHVAGVAIERHWTATELARSTTRLADESRLSAALAQVGREMISSLSRPVLLDRLCQLTTELLESDVSDTFIHDPVLDTYAPVASHGYTPDERESLRVTALAAPPLATVFETLARRGILQIATEDVTEPACARLLREYDIGHSLYVALRCGTHLVGFLCVGRRRPAAAYTPFQERLATGIGQLASLALENARLVEEHQRASQLKSEFVSTMSHELRTPLSVILGYTDMLGDDNLPPAERTRTLGRIRRAGLELLDMIEDTLNLGRLENGRDPASIETVAIPALLEELAGEFAALGTSAAITLRWEPNGAATIDTDRRKLRMILKNLVGNALKFTPHGEVVVRAEVRADRCAFVVRDTGVGIAAERLPVIFEMFRQGDSSDSRSYGGVGLGLYIVQRLLDQLHGDVAVASAPGKGTTFTVTLPVHASLPLTA